MKLGFLTDIHENVEHLRHALARFRTESVDQIVVLGDLFELGERIDETCRLLSAAGAIGVWGNHDIGLCFNPDEELIAKYSNQVHSFMSSLQGRLVLDGCHFTHVEPWLNPEEPMDLWYFEGPPDEHGNLDRIFDSVPERLMFCGHYHKWLLATPQEILDWRGEKPISLRGGRYFVVIGALSQGQFATFNTSSSELFPLNTWD